MPRTGKQQHDIVNMSDQKFLAFFVPGPHQPAVGPYLHGTLCRRRWG